MKRIYHHQLSVKLEQEKVGNDLTLLSEVEIKYKPEVKPKDRPKGHDGDGGI